MKNKNVKNKVSGFEFIVIAIAYVFLSICYFGFIIPEMINRYNTIAMCPLVALFFITGNRILYFSKKIRFSVLR